MTDLAKIPRSTRRFFTSVAAGILGLPLAVHRLGVAAEDPGDARYIEILRFSPISGRVPVTAAAAILT